MKNDRNVTKKCSNVTKMTETLRKITVMLRKTTETLQNIRRWHMSRGLSSGHVTTCYSPVFFKEVRMIQLQKRENPENM